MGASVSSQTHALYACQVCFSAGLGADGHDGQENISSDREKQVNSGREPQRVPNFSYPDARPRSSYHSARSEMSINSRTQANTMSKGQRRDKLRRRKDLGLSHEPAQEANDEPVNAETQNHLGPPIPRAYIAEPGRVSPMPNFEALETEDISEMYAASIRSRSRPSTSVRDPDDDDHDIWSTPIEPLPLLPINIPDAGFVIGEVKSDESLQRRCTSPESQQQRRRSGSPRRTHSRAKSLSERRARSASRGTRNRAFSSRFHRDSDGPSVIDDEIKELKYLVDSKRGSNMSSHLPYTRDSGNGGWDNSSGHVPAIAPGMRSSARREVLEDIGSALARPLTSPHSIPDHATNQYGMSSNGMHHRRMPSNPHTPQYPEPRRASTPLQHQVKQTTDQYPYDPSCVGRRDLHPTRKTPPPALMKPVRVRNSYSHSHTNSGASGRTSHYPSPASTPASTSASRFSGSRFSSGTSGTYAPSDAWTSRTNVNSFASRVSAMGVPTTLEGQYPGSTLSDYALR